MYYKVLLLNANLKIINYKIALSLHNIMLLYEWKYYNSIKFLIYSNYGL